MKQLIQKGADLNNPGNVETVLATEKFTVSKKASLVAAYRSYTKTFGIPWIPIRTRYRPQQPHIPLESELDQIIAASGRKTAAFLQTLKDTARASDEYYSAVAKTVDEARKLVESGFTFVSDIEGMKVFSKRK